MFSAGISSLFQKSSEQGNTGNAEKPRPKDRCAETETQRIAYQYLIDHGRGEDNPQYAKFLESFKDCAPHTKK